MNIRELRLDAKGVKSLCWQGDSLVDWVSGGTVYRLDGSVQPRHVHYAYRFDAAKVSPSQRYAVLYEKLGTKALLLDEGKIIREFHRSFYYAHAYEYPLELCRLSDGREVVIHCPERYCALEIDDLATGERLTHTPNREPGDYFFSRLAVSQNSQYLLTAGWVWHPLDIVLVYEMDGVLKNPELLDGHGLEINERLPEENSAAFMGDDRVVVACSVEVDEYEHEGDEEPIRTKIANWLAIYDLGFGRRSSLLDLEEKGGTLMPVGPEHVLGFFDHPKLISLQTGKVIHRWAGLRTGRQSSSIIWGIDPVPPLALDVANRRFAVATDAAIDIVEIEL